MGGTTGQKGSFPLLSYNKDSRSRAHFPRFVEAQKKRSRSRRTRIPFVKKKHTQIVFLEWRERAGKGPSFSGCQSSKGRATRRIATFCARGGENCVGLTHTKKCAVRPRHKKILERVFLLLARCEAFFASLVAFVIFRLSPPRPPYTH